MKKIATIQLAAVLVLFNVCFASAQRNENDTVSVVNKKANRAALLSMVLPGAGQVFNNRYWKVPVIYAGAAALVYFVSDNNKNYQDFKDAYAYRIDGDSTTNDLKYATLSNEDIIVRKDYFRRNRDLSYVLLGVLYGLNIVDAYVDAHLRGFDVSDNLSMSASPWFNPAVVPAAGITVTFTLR